MQILAGNRQIRIIASWVTMSIEVTTGARLACIGTAMPAAERGAAQARSYLLAAMLQAQIPRKLLSIAGQS